jgi:Protein of unknown function (DUF2442)
MCENNAHSTSSLHMGVPLGFPKSLNFEPILSGPMFEPLRNLTLFNQVTLDHDLGTLVWPTGADIDPTVLHDWPDHIDAIIERRRKLFAIPS